MISTSPGGLPGLDVEDCVLADPPRLGAAPDGDEVAAVELDDLAAPHWTAPLAGTPMLSIAGYRSQAHDPRAEVDGVRSPNAH